MDASENALASSPAGFEHDLSQSYLSQFMPLAQSAGQAPTATLQAFASEAEGIHVRHITFPSSSAPQIRVNEVARSITRRTQSATSRRPLDVTHDALAMANRIWDRIVRNLNANHIETSRLVDKRFGFLFPFTDSTLQEMAIWNALLENPMMVTPAELASVMRLRQVTARGELVGGEGFTFYIRSWTLTREELEQIITAMTRDGFRFGELSNWERQMQSVRVQDTQLITIRYVGQCSNMRSPWTRLLEDFESHKSGIFVEFARALEEYLPQVAAGVRVDIVERAALYYSSQMLADDIERVLIEFFDHSTLLNRQRGGHYASYLPRAEDMANFRDLGTQFNEGFDRLAKLLSPVLCSDISQHFEEVQEWANSNPELSGTYGGKVLSNKLRDVYAEQATPHQVNGYTILTFLGKDITVEGYFDPCTFLKSSGRASRIVYDSLGRLVYWEQAGVKDEWSHEFFQPQWFCFRDLWCTLWHKSRSIATQQLKAYLRIVKPIVVVSYSAEVNNIVQSDFEVIDKIKVGGISMQDEVALPTIQFLDKNDPQRTAFINVPHFHPGYDKYTDQLSTYRRVADLSNQLLFLLADEILNVISNPNLQLDPQDRRSLCEEVLARYHQRLQTPRAAATLGSLEDARNTWCENNQAILESKLVKSRQTYLQRGREQEEEEFAKPRDSNLPGPSATQPSIPVPTKGGPKIQVQITDSEGATVEHDVLLPLLNREGVTRMADFGQLDGEPGSIERVEQLNAWWEVQRPELHVAIPNTTEMKQKWIDQLLREPEGRYMLLFVVSKVQNPEYLSRLLRCFRKEGTDGTAFLFNSHEFQEALIHANQWLEKRLKGAVSYPTRINYFQTLHEPIDFEGYKVRIDCEGVIRLKWEKGSNNTQTIILHARSAVKLESTDVRRIRFTESGINVVNQHEEAFLSSANTAIPSAGLRVATIPKHDFLHSSDGKAVAEFWKEVRTAMGYRPEMPQIAMEEWTGDKGLDFIPVNMTEEKRPQNKPVPNEYDANYLLVAFLDAKLPNGGTIYTAAGIKDPAQAEMDTSDFIQFIEDPKYRGHPFAEQWLGKLKSRTTGPSIISKNMPLYRATEILVDRRRKGGRYWKIGEIGTFGIVNIDDIEAEQEKANKQARDKRAKAKRKKKKQKAREEGDDDESSSDSALPEPSRGERGKARKVPAAASTAVQTPGVETTDTARGRGSGRSRGVGATRSRGLGTSRRATGASRGGARANTRSQSRSEALGGELSDDPIEDP